MDCGAAAYQAVWVAIRILVVDDNQHFRRHVGELFMLRGLEVVDAAADGKDALAAVVCACPDGVLVDINLPGRDGYSVAASLAAICPAGPDRADLLRCRRGSDCGPAGVRRYGVCTQD
jgi:CheY-like chemotaxis protein